MSVFIQYDEPRVIEWIGFNEICRNARFVFDRPFKMELDDILQLDDGCWYLISCGYRYSMSGRWDR